MRNIKISKIKKTVKDLLTKANFYLPDDVINALKKAIESESGQAASDMLEMIFKNSRIAAQRKLPLCQDCGSVYIEIEIGRDVCIIYDESENQKNDKGFIDLEINKTVAETYKDLYLRTSIVDDPLFNRKNTGTNTPANIDYRFSEDSGLRIKVCLKGGGSDNCSWMFMLNPSAGKNEIIKKVEELVSENVTRACPPVIIGIGIGGSASTVTGLAKKAVFRSLDVRNNNKEYAELEAIILEVANNTGIGPQSIRGKTTALACNIEYAPCHMASLPFAVFFGCHSMRRAEITI